MAFQQINPVLEEINKMQRRLRTPTHTFHIRHEPFQIQPFMIAPVLAGETVKKVNMQWRAVTDPIKNPLIGWWLEHYMFYVKLTDLDGRDDFVDMLIDPAKDMSAYNKAADVLTYHAGPGIDWVQECLEHVVQKYFRNEAAGELWNDHTIGGMPIAAVNQQNVLDSLISDADKETGTAPAALETPEAHLENLSAFQFLQRLQMSGITNMEEYLASFGIKQDPEKLREAETMRYSRDWTYPTNTIDPTDGSPTSACSWSSSLSADKDRFFKEPGFIFGVTVARPKIYLSAQKGSAVSALNDSLSWLPAIMADDPMTSLVEYAALSGIIPTSTGGYWIDLRDLFLYGEQFCNFALTATDAGMVALPTAALQRDYAAEADTDALFVNAAGGYNLCRQDGVANLRILGRQQDYSATT